MSSEAQARIAVNQAHFDQDWARLVDIFEKNMERLMAVPGVLSAANTFDELRFVSSAIGVDDKQALALVQTLALASINRMCFEVNQRRQEGETDGE